MRTLHLTRSALAVLALAALPASPARAGDAPAPGDPAAASFDGGRVHTVVPTSAPGDLAALQSSAPASRGRPPPRGPRPEGAPEGPPPGADPGEDDFEYVPARFALDGA